MDWKKDEVLNLIDLYCSNTCLWDFMDPNYKNRDMKREAIISIANELNRDIHEVEKKMHGLRTQFNREHKRYQKQILLNGRFREVQKPTWFAYEPLEFVAKCINPRSPGISIKKEEASWSGFEVEVENDGSQVETSEIEMRDSNGDAMLHTEPEIIVECLDTPNNIVTTTASPTVNPLPVPVVSIKREIKLNDCEKSRLYYKRQRIEKTNEKVLESPCESFAIIGTSTELNPRATKVDEYIAFAQYVHQELKKITNPYALQMTKLKINQILFDATTGSYDRMSSGIVGTIKTPLRSQMVITSKIQPYEPSRTSANSTPSASGTNE